jgi:hypothetical protein
METHPGPLIVPTLVITEVTYFLSDRVGAEAEMRFLEDIVSGFFLVQPVADGDWPRIAELVERYRDLPLGTVDASVVALAERLGLRDIATIDRTDFSVVRPNHVSAFNLLPIPDS